MLRCDILFLANVFFFFSGNNTDPLLTLLENKNNLHKIPKIYYLSMVILCSIRDTHKIQAMEFWYSEPP